MTRPAGRDDWTDTPETAVRHALGRMPADEVKRLLILYRSMAAGGDGGQIEPWGPSIRSVVYPGWTDDDFAAAVRNINLGL